MRTPTAVIGASVVLAATLAGHRLVPNIYSAGSLLDSVVPVLGAGVPVLAVVALAARSRRALLSVALPAAVWAVMFGGLVLPPPGGPVEMSVVSQNLYAANPDPMATLRRLADTGPDLLAIQEVTGDTAERAAAELTAYPAHAAVDTVALFSRFPIADASPLDSSAAWIRGLRAVVRTPHGEVAVYVVHLGSARFNETAARDQDIEALAGLVRADPAPRVLLVGDLNTAATDRAIAPLTAQLRDAQADAGWGYGLTWPSAFPLLRPDQMLYRGLTATAAGVIATPGSDHRAVRSGFAL
jgi:vancomycin resistance protein VanJ